MFVFGGLLCGIPALIVEMTKDSPASDAYEAFCIGFFCGGIVIGVCLTHCGMRLVSAFLGACGGAMVGVGGYFLVRGDSGPVLEFIEQGQMGAIVSAVGLAVVGALAGVAFERLIVICLTSAVGSAFCLLAWDCGFGWRIRPLDFLGGLAVCALISCYVQCRITGRDDDGYGGVAEGPALYVHPRDRPLLPTCTEIQGYCDSEKKTARHYRRGANVQQQPLRLSATEGISMPSIRSSTGLNTPLLVEGEEETTVPSDSPTIITQPVTNVAHRSDPTDFRGAFWGRPPRRGQRRAFQPVGGEGNDDVEQSRDGGDNDSVDDDADVWYEVDNEDDASAVDLGDEDRESANVLDKELEDLLLEEDN